MENKGIHHQRGGVRNAVTLALVLASMSLGSAETPGQPDPEVMAQGLAVYQTEGCGSCHTLSAAGSHGTIGPNQDHIGSIAAARILEPTYQGSATDAAGYIEESITTPNAYIARAGFGPATKFMPSYQTLSPEDLHAMVQLLLAQQAPSP